jgi:hypothetical protein
MNRNLFLCLLLTVIGWPFAAQAQYVAVGGGGVFSKGFSGPAQTGIGGVAQADFSKSGVLSLDGGVGVFPFLDGGIHYSLSKPELSLRRGDSFGSSAVVGLTAHTLTFDARMHTPNVSGFRLFGLVGAGFSRYQLTSIKQVEVPFSRGAPDSVLTPVFTYGAGIERSLLPFIRWKFEARDDVSRMPKEFFQPGGVWHRPQVVVGIVIGR